MATIALLGVAGVVCLYFNQTMEKPPFSPDLSAWFDKAPRLPVAVWDALFVTTGLIALQMLRIRRKLSQPDAAVTAGSKG